jgi:hypothetical protein
MVAYAIHPEQVGLWLFMGSEIQATFSFRTFHNAHTAGVGQQVADYALNGFVMLPVVAYTRV